MRLRPFRLSLPWLVGLCLAATLGCLALAVYLGAAARQEAKAAAIGTMTERAGALARQIESDVGLFDLALRAAAAQGRGAGEREGNNQRIAPPEHPLTAKQISFINVLNEVGDVIADSRSNVSRPANFAGRDYFLEQQRNPADTLLIGRPFATVPPQNAAIPISRRLNRPDGSFGGVVVAGVHLTWLRDLLPAGVPVTVRREDGVILARAPFDANDIGRPGEADPIWETYRRTGASVVTDDAGGVRLFRAVGGVPLVLEIAGETAPGGRSWLPLLVAIPGVCALCLGLVARGFERRTIQIETAARQANDDRMRLLATMSHELRTPLTGILGQADLLLKEGGLDEHQAARLARLTEAGTSMRDIVNRVIDFARPDDHMIAPILAVCDLDLLVRTCRGMVETAARAKGLDVIGQVDPSAQRYAALDRGLVEQVLINLLMNAVKFTARGTIVLRLFGTPEELRFEVADTGPGVPAHKRHRLFQEYDRLDLGETGSGLGLSISERIVSRLGGRIGHRDNPGGGSVFWVTLPFVVPGAEAGEPDAADPPPETGKLRILIADDMDLTRDVTAGYLCAAGHEVTGTSGGEAAIRAAQTGDFDLLITDMRMPGCDGLETTRRLRALPGRNGRIPVILLTADLEARRHGVSSGVGVDLCLMKPFKERELLEGVAEAASLVPPPRDPAIDDAILSQLLASMGRDKVEANLDAAACRIEALLAMLEAPNVAQMDREQTAHDLVGAAGLMGLTALSASLRHFETAPDRGEAERKLREAATDAVLAIRRRGMRAAA